MKTIRRLVLSLDGTWNNRDDSTNVLYSHSLAFECREKEWNGGKVTQERYYQEGVGTGPLDRLTGGGFGFGLDSHVRDAYNWLVQNFEDGDGTKTCPPDEIYIFGFSRGAYTARSLVGFISMCGLLRRGAPLTVSQLWENYCILGLAREERSGGIMAKIFGRPVPKFRRITDLAYDPWDRRAGERVLAGQSPHVCKVEKLNPTENLLVRWSRRVKITYLGVYDTVGAVGWDALAIPGLRSKLAVQHNMRPSTIIQNCRHALAMDEHRSSFNHTPFVAYKGAKECEEEDERDQNDKEKDSETTPPAKETNWDQAIAIWCRKIEQRWFVGAHSNIGGGYADNLLAQRPLEWILEGAREARGLSGGLICEKTPPPNQLSPSLAKARDSYAEFAAPFWTHFFRAKRNYRVLWPLPELRANRDEAKKKKLSDIRAGFSLASVNEQVDDTVWKYWKDSATAPPNLIGFAKRASLSNLDGKTSENVWLGAGFGAQFSLVLWAMFAAAGVASANSLFCIWPSSPPLLLLLMIGFLLPLVDWTESWANSFLAGIGTSPWQKALLDSIYWTRSIGVVLFFFGVTGGALNLWSTGWHTVSYADASHIALELVWRWGGVGLAAAAGALAGNALNKSVTKTALLAMAVAIVVIGLAIVLIIPLTHGIGHVVTAALGKEQTIGTASFVSEQVRTAGLLLLLLIVFAYFVRTFIWVGEPMNRANLGSITPLQWSWSPAKVKDCLQRWQKMIDVNANATAAREAMTGIVRQALWRDGLGFIPVYSCLLFFGLWFSSQRLGWAKLWPPLEYLWFVVPAIGLISDYLENCFHYQYLSLHLKDDKPSWFTTGFTCFFALVKSIAFVAGTLTVLLGIFCAIGHIAWNPREYGLRGLTAILITAGTVLLVMGILLWGLAYRIWNRLNSNQAAR